MDGQQLMPSCRPVICGVSFPSLAGPFCSSMGILGLVSGMCEQEAGAMSAKASSVQMLASALADGMGRRIFGDSASAVAAGSELLRLSSESTAKKHPSLATIDNTPLWPSALGT